MDTMYSEHLIAGILDMVGGTVTSSAALDAALTRPVVQVGRVIGPQVGAGPSDGSLWRLAVAEGVPVPVGTRGAVHGLHSGSVGLGLGPSRGIIESTGNQLVVLTEMDPSRYKAAYRLPTIRYGGLI